MKSPAFCCTVTSANGTYTTSQINGQKASCTAGEQQAAQALAKKLLGDTAVVRQQHVPNQPHGRTFWNLYGKGDKGALP